VKRCLSCRKPFGGDGWQCRACGWAPSVMDGFLAFAPELALESESYPQGVDAQITSVEDNCFWFEGRKEVIAEALNRFFPEKRRFLEIGCGTGHVLSWLAKTRPRVRFAGSDVYLSSLRLARRRLPAAEFIQMDACRIPFQEEFDVVGAFDVLEHIEDDRTALSAMHMAIKPGGGLLLTVPQHKWLWSPADEAACHKRRYTRPELQKKVQEAGFEIMWMSSFITFLLPLMLLSRMRLKMARDRTNASVVNSELPMDGVANRFCKRVLDLERAALRRFSSFPIGGSIICAGKKK
jgi:SAM-dependent methyltransferase